MSRRILVVGLALGIGGSVLVLLASLLLFLDTLEWKVRDQVVQWNADPGRASKDVVLVAIDKRARVRSSQRGGLAVASSAVSAVDRLSRPRPRCRIGTG